MTNQPPKTEEHSGGQVNYYLVEVKHPRRDSQPAYQAECEDIISALGMTFDEGCAFKAIWRSAAARNSGTKKKGHDPVYDAQKVQHYGRQMEHTAKHALSDAIDEWKQTGNQPSFTLPNEFVLDETRYNKLPHVPS